jgi:hypothetical protein
LKELEMIHTGDIFEQRARNARHHELRAMTRAISGFLFGNLRAQKNNRVADTSVPHHANDQTTEENRAA